MTETPMEVFGQIGPFSDEILFGDVDAATERLASMTPLDAVRLVLASRLRNDAVISDVDLSHLAYHLGVFAD